MKEVTQTQAVASILGIKALSSPVRSTDDFQNAFAKMLKEGARAIAIIQGPFLALHRKKILELTNENRLPSICDDPIWTENGCLASYGPNRNEMYRRAAYYVDRILKGANPGDLPVEQPTKFELVLNLRTAKQLGVNIPQKVLTRADRVIR